MSGSAAPAISVIIPHLDQPDLLRQCLHTLAGQQDAPGFETIVVDNGSRELPGDVCTEFGARLLQEAVPGPGPARNRGAAAAQAPLLAFTDADCRLDTGWLAAIARAFADPQAQVIGGDVKIAAEDPGALTSIEAYESIYAFRTRLYIERDRYTATLNMAVRRDVFGAVGPFGGIEMAEDIDWGMRASDMGMRLEFVPGMLVFHPARRDFSELCRKWDRHVAHFYDETRAGGLWWPRWMAKTAAVAVSPLAELPRILTSERIAGTDAKRRAVSTMTRIRLYRARRMLALGLGGDPQQLSNAWRRT